MPSSLTILLPSALGFSPHPPVSVCGTGTVRTIAAFLDTASSCFPTSVRSSHTLPSRTSLTPCPASCFPHDSVHGDAPAVCPRSSVVSQYRNLHLSSIDYGSRPRLRPRLTQSRSALLWNPWIFGRKDSHLSLATHSGILSSRPSTAPFGTASSSRQCSSTNHTDSAASVSCFSPVHFRRRTSRPVSYYALFE